MLKTKQHYYDLLYKTVGKNPEFKKEFEELIEVVDECFYKERYIINLKKYIRRKCEHIAKVTGLHTTKAYMEYMLGPYQSNTGKKNFYEV